MQKPSARFSLAVTDERRDRRLTAARDVLRTEARALEHLTETLDASFGQVLDLLQRCRGRVVVSGVGRSGHVAQCMASTLSRAGVPSLFLHAADAAHGDLGAVTSADVALLVSHSGATPELLLLLPCLEQLKVPIAAIVGTKHSPLGRSAHYVLCTEASRQTISELASLALVDALAAGLRAAATESF